MKSQIILILTVFSIQLFASSCATVEQVAAIEKKTNELSEKVDYFDKKYSEVLAENKKMKDLLQDRIPLVSAQIGGLVFDAMKVVRDGTRLNIELLVTNKNDYDVSLAIEYDRITVVDDLGNQYKVGYSNYSFGKGDKYTLLYAGTGVKMHISIDDFNKEAKTLSVVGINKFWEDIKKQELRIALKNIQIK